MSNIIEVKALSMAYRDVIAVDDVSFSIEEGKIYGLLGRNGAGKTSIMQLLTAQIFPTHGDIKVFGEAPYENNKVLSKLCFIKESQRYPDIFRVKDVLKVAAGLFPNWDRVFANELVEDFRLPLNRRMNKLSRGMLSSVGIIVGLASRAPLTIFDEPYIGLDAVARSLFYDRLLEDYAEHPRTVILSTHLIDEVSRLLEHVIVIDAGKIIIDEAAESIRGRAITVTGLTPKVESFTKDKEVIHRETFGAQMSATVMGNWNTGQRKEAEMQGLDVEPVSLQQLIIHLTSSKSSRRAVVS